MMSVDSLHQHLYFWVEQVGDLTHWNAGVAIATRRQPVRALGVLGKHVGQELVREVGWVKFVGEKYAINI